MLASSRARMFPLHKIVLVTLLLAPFASASDWDYQETHTESHDFAAGGTLHVRAHIGDLHITRGKDPGQIHLRYTIKSKHESALKNSKVEFEVHGRDARLEFNASRSGTQFDIELEVPESTSLEVHEKIGDLRIENIEGDKDLELGIGDIQITNENSRYRLVRASTGIGDVNSGGYGETSGWLGKTLKYHGDDGKYELRAHVGIGDIRLEGK
jgi:hypothetical protein